MDNDIPVIYHAIVPNISWEYLNSYGEVSYDTLAIDVDECFSFPIRSPIVATTMLGIKCRWLVWVSPL